MRYRLFYSVATLGLMYAAWASHFYAAAADNVAPPLSPSESIRAFRLADDQLTIELVAAEPDVVSPVAVSWDENGRMYVTEMSDYPTGPTSGKIKLLEGIDGGGKVRKTTIFADKLPFPTGTLPWKGGIFVTAAPDILYLKATKDRSTADERRIVLTGFHKGNQQLLVNGLNWGLDNWIYGANGRSDGEVRRPQDPKGQAASISRRDFRFRPDTGEVESITGQSQFGMARDDWGNRFPSWNTNPIRHVVLEQSYLSRNSWLAAGSSVGDMIAPADLHVHPISQRPQTFNNESVSSFNASCGITVYRDGVLGESYRGNAFICEPLTNLVQRRLIKPAGPTFLAERGEQGKEFLSSTDPWFHPVNLATGPDGALYILDFYRQWIEHPDFVPKESREKVEWRKGANYGRIWRIRRKDVPCPPVPRLGEADSAGLVKELGNSNGWRRDTAQRLLVEKQDPQAVPLLKVALSQSQSPLARVHALWVLQSFKAADDELLALALSDTDPHVREQALRLCEGRLANPAIRRAVVACADDGDARVRFQCALALGGLSGREELRALARIAARDGENEWTRLAIVSGLGETATRSLALLMEAEPTFLTEPSTGQAEVLRQIAAIIGARNRDPELEDCLALLNKQAAKAPPIGKLAILAGLLEGLSRSPRPWRKLVANAPAGLEGPIRDLDALLTAVSATATTERAQVAHVVGVLAGAGAGGATAAAERAQVAHRVLAIEALSLAKPASVSKAMEDLLQPRQPVLVQLAAARSIAVIGDAELVARALVGWPKYTISTRQEILRAVSRSALTASVLLQALERKEIMSVEVDSTIRESLRQILDKDFQTRLAKILVAPNKERAAVVAKMKTALTQLETEGRTADTEAGARLFAKNCLTCHQVQGQGLRVGPELAGISNRSADALIEDILDPSKQVTPDYRNFILHTKDGRTLSGLLSAETASSVTLRRAGGTEDTVLRTEIEEFRATGASVMPDGFEQVLRPSDMADLLAFLRRIDTAKLPPPER